MSSVLIRGMKMPDSCIACKFGRETNYAGDFKEKCLINGKCGYVSVRKPRLHTCPLVKIETPHGRLGDLDALYKEISNGNKAYNGIEGYDEEYPNISNVDDCLDAIKYAETVIEAERNGE